MREAFLLYYKKQTDVKMSDILAIIVVFQFFFPSFDCNI